MRTPTGEQPLVTLASAGTSIVLRTSDSSLPTVLHWGTDLGSVDDGELGALAAATASGVSPSALDEPWPLTLLPTEADGWSGRPGIELVRNDRLVIPHWSDIHWRVEGQAFLLTATAGGLEFRLSLALDDAGVITVRQSIRNTGSDRLGVASLESTLPVTGHAGEILDFSGKWIHERQPQRSPFTEGSLSRETRRGRTGHDSPYLLVAGTRGFDDRSGEVWATHLAWSGDSVYRRDNLPETLPLIGTGELLRPGEVVLEPGELYEAPASIFVWSDRGLDGLSARLHSSLRARPTHPRTPRPVVLNTWEAVYFDHDQDRLLALAEVAAAVGVERFVLDDGWFLHRRSDQAGLGDWFVDPGVWPDGLHPLVDRVRGLGMEFGLWVEPEMVNLDSDLARAHPDWVLGPSDRHPRSWRHQQVLDLTNREARSWVLTRIAALVEEHDLAYLKWDHNRDIHEGLTRDGRGAVHEQTSALYGILDQLKERFPALEIESCASGGGRVDLGVLAHTDRVWASDTNDPLERIPIQRWTELLIPPELVGSHIGPERAHTTGRHSDLGFRMAATLFASAGLELNILNCTAEEQRQLADWHRFYKRVRQTIHTGTLHHPATGEGGTELTGAVAQDRTHAIYRYARLQAAGSSGGVRIAFAGLDEEPLYRVDVVDAVPPATLRDVVAPGWYRDGSITLRGEALMRLGLVAPILNPSQAIVLELTAVDE